MELCLNKDVLQHLLMIIFWVVMMQTA